MVDSNALSETIENDGYDEEEYYFLSDESNNEGIDDREHFCEDLICNTLTTSQTIPILELQIAQICQEISVAPWIARLFLRKLKSDVQAIVQLYKQNPLETLKIVSLIPHNEPLFLPDSEDLSLIIEKITPNHTLSIKSHSTDSDLCLVCLSPSTSIKDLKFENSITFTNEPEKSYLSSWFSDCVQHLKLSDPRLYGMTCGHCFCLSCWQVYFRVQLTDSNVSVITCMETQCNVRVPDDFLLAILGPSKEATNYNNMLVNELIKAHPRLRLCPNTHCFAVIHAHDELCARKACCDACGAEFCFLCGTPYHAPTDCDTIKLWLQKCSDDSETAQYITAHTKDCPKCGVCIEKNGGCNHMQCFKCQESFCWVCLGPWKSHSAQFYVCSKYQEIVAGTEETERNRARTCLKRYLFYYERWENHERSLQLEKEHYASIQDRVQSKLLNNEGTWIDWQHLSKAAEILRKCRYTLKYTYPYAYYPNKTQCLPLFEYQQGLLEAEVEDLSWKILHPEITDRVDLLNKMSICEKHRQTLLQEFLKT